LIATWNMPFSKKRQLNWIHNSLRHSSVLLNQPLTAVKRKMSHPCTLPCIRHHIPENRTLHSYSCKNLKFNTDFIWLSLRNGSHIHMIHP
jgi:hypothetical protein